MNPAAEQLPVLATYEPAHRPATDAVLLLLLLLLLNAQHASPGRSHRQAEWIAGQEDSDIAVLTEVSSTQGGDTRLPHGHRLPYQRGPAGPQPGHRHTPSGPSGTRHRRRPRHRSAGPIRALPRPEGPAQRRQARLQEAVTESLPRLLADFPGMPVIVAGDLNVIQRGHQPPHKVFGEWEYAFYNSFQAAGLIDAYRRLHPDELAHSWFGRSGNGFRFDHLFISARHADRVLACDYHCEARKAGLTDHAVMTLRLGLPSTPGGQGEAPATSSG
ncbi:endonuclease [Streptomyces sp. NPDC006514]|uniref:endonuclease n=1 Tax=Streptomyces sp. NPDC006514 TaxID=3154308 RepID=UPI0033B66381